MLLSFLNCTRREVPVQGTGEFLFKDINKERLIRLTINIMYFVEMLYIELVRKGLKQILTQQLHVGFVKLNFETESTKVGCSM